MSFGLDGYAKITVHCVSQIFFNNMREAKVLAVVYAYFGLTRQSPVPSLGTRTRESSGKREGPVEERKGRTVGKKNPAYVFVPDVDQDKKQLDRQRKSFVFVKSTTETQTCRDDTCGFQRTCWCMDLASCGSSMAGSCVWNSLNWLPSCDVVSFSCIVRGLFDDNTWLRLWSFLPESVVKGFF